MNRAKRQALLEQLRHNNYRRLHRGCYWRVLSDALPKGLAGTANTANTASGDASQAYRERCTYKRIGSKIYTLTDGKEHSVAALYCKGIAMQGVNAAKRESRKLQATGALVYAQS